MSQEIFIQVKFKIPTDIGEYSDSLFYPQAEYELLSPAEIDVAINDRVTTYLTNIKNQPTQTHLREEELVTLKNNLQAQNTQIQNQIVEVDAAIVIAHNTDKDNTPPTTPANLETSKITNAVIILIWDKATDSTTGISGYNIYRDGKLLYSVGENTYSDFKVSPDTTYSYEIQAIDFNKNISALSKALVVKTLK